MADAVEKSDDVALLLGATEGAEKVAVLRKRGARVEATLLQKLEEGRPIHGDVLRLSARDEPHLYDVETLHRAPRSKRTGPAQVATSSYRTGWDRLFKGKRSRVAN